MKAEEVKTLEKEEKPEEAVQQPEKAEVQRARQKTEISDKRALIKHFLDQGYRLRVKVAKGRLYLTARKTVEGKRVEKSVGRLDDDTKRIIRELGLKVK